MKIVDRKTFLSMPANTVYTKYSPCYFGELHIKGDTCGENDFFEQQIIDAIEARDTGEFLDKIDDAEKNGTVLHFDFHCEGRDGLFEDDQLFAVWDKADVQDLVDRLKECL